MAEPQMWIYLPGGNMKKSLVASLSAFALILGLFGAVLPTANAALNVPKAAWPVCSQTRTVFCVESISVTTLSGGTVALTWVPDGVALAPIDTSTATVDTSTATSDTSTAPVVTAPTVSTGRAISGRWTSLDWSSKGLDVLGYDGLYVEAKTANDFVNHFFINVLPTITTTANKVNVATQPANTSFPANLDADLIVDVTVKTGEVKPGVLVGVGTNFTGDYSTANGQSTIKLWAADGRFPKPTVLSSTIKVWRHKDVVSWIDQQVELQASIELAAESEQAELRLVSG